MIHVLLIEDDKDAGKMILYRLSQEECYTIEWATGVRHALQLMHEHFDVILLDVMLPDGNGISLCEKLREQHSCPILFISCLSDNDTIIRALNEGGDDYIPKPFDIGVLHARIQANLRRVEMERKREMLNCITLNGISLKAENHTVTIDGREIPLHQTEYRILAFLMDHAGKCYRSSELYRYIWGESSFGDNRTVVVHIYNLRKKIEKDPQKPKIIRSVWKKGYCFDPQGRTKEDEGTPSP